MNTARFKSRRLQKGLTQTDISKQLGVALSLAGQWERGEKTPSTQLLPKLAKLLDVSVSWLLEEGVSELPQDYENTQLAGPAIVLADYDAPPGLRELASNAQLVAALQIQPGEWTALRSLKSPTLLSVHGYLAILLTIRGSVTES
jgi:transcriptional regulator with XRE-family HTH domain